jgi:hypothetical protein
MNTIADTLKYFLSAIYGYSPQEDPGKVTDPEGVAS